MKLKTLKLDNFKNLNPTELEFSSGINVICGENAAGKTNILEGIFLFAAGKSFRGCKDRELINFNEESACCSICFESGTSEKRMAMAFSRGEKKQITVNGERITKLSEYLGLFRAVIFAPLHLNLVKGSPEFRRRFLDMAICQSFPRYVASLNEYNRLLLQKNALLRTENPSSVMLSVYNEKMASVAAIITQNRRKYTEQLETEAQVFQNELSGGKEKLVLRYESQAGDEKFSLDEIKQKYISVYEERQELETRRKMTLYGPHKDDFSVFINQKSARIFASQGQQRSAVLSLKLGEGELSKRLTDEYPVFLFDDVLSELDADRRAYILGAVSGRQLIITGCERELFEKCSATNRIIVKNGVVS